VGAARPSRVTQREKEREKESSPPPAGNAAPRQASMDSVEEYTEAEGDDEMADTEVRALSSFASLPLSPAAVDVFRSSPHMELLERT
jgi:hypothetical protein